MPSWELPDYPFRRLAHDRLAERRADSEFLDQAWRDPATRVLVSRGDTLATSSSGDQLHLLASAEAPAGERMLLGRSDGVVYFLVVTPPGEAAGVQTGQDLARRPDGGPQHFTALRHFASLLDDVAASLAVHATALASWHARHPRCAVCGAATLVAEAGAQRHCSDCSTPHFPRTDPAVIMLVTDDHDRCLLGHNSARPDGWFSTLAGFLEPGETPEQAVAREVREEVGIAVRDIAYAGSQPWPFPSSLMLGYFARAATTTLEVDGTEITDARWFTRDQLAADVGGGRVGLPNTVSIAGALIAAWYGGPLPVGARRR